MVPRQTHLVVKVFPDELSAFQAYRLLNYHGITPEHLTIVGEGYSSPERIGLLRPMQIALRKALGWAIVSGTLGTLVGTLLYGFGLPRLISAAIPAIEGFMPNVWMILALGFMTGFSGAVLGGLVGLFGEGTAASIYRHHLNRGHYLLMMEGSEQLIRWGQEVLGHYSISRLY